MILRRARHFTAAEAASEIPTVSLKDLEKAVFSAQPVPVEGVLGISRGTLKPALEAVQALVGVQGAALFVADETQRLWLHVGILGDSSLLNVPELCAAVARSGRAASSLLPVASRPDAMFDTQAQAPGDKHTFIAMPLFHEARLAGVLYLEGLTDISIQSMSALLRCARILACMLGNSVLATPGEALA